MKWFYDLRISTKLLIGFILVALIAGLVGYVGISSLRSADESDTVLFERNAVPLSAMIDLVGHFQRMRANGLDLLIARTPEEHQKALKAIQGRSAEIDQDKAIIQKTIISAEIQQKMDEFTKVDNNFDGLFKQFVSLCTSDNDAGAEALWKGDLDKARKDEQNALSALDDILTQRAKNRSDKNSENADSAVRNMIIIVIAAMIIAVALGLFLSKVISNPLKKAVLMFKEIGKGHLSGRMNLDSKDEIGEMAKTFDKFSEDLQKIVVGTLIKISEGDTSVDIKPMDGEDEIAPALQRLNMTIKDLIAEVNSLSQDAVEGKLSSRGNAGKFQGGYKEIVQGINATMNAVIEPINESGRILEILAQGDLTARMTGDYRGDYRKIKDNINGMADSFSQALSDVTEAVQATASAANEISSSSEQMAAGAQEQSQQATEVAGAIEEMTKTVYETAKNANEAADMSRASRVAAEKGAKKIDETKKGIEKIVSSADDTARIVSSLSKRSEQIGEITQVIDDIADQTNLLALNAAIEAARAGEQGRGFAVVADEVRKLAERTTKATKEIAETIKAIQNEAKEADSAMSDSKTAVIEGMKMTEEVAEVLNEILNGAVKATDVVLQVAAASEEQSSAAEQISKNIEGISAVTQQSASGTEQIARAAEDLNRLTVNLQEMVGRFRLEGGGSKNTIGRMAVRDSGKLIGR